MARYPHHYVMEYFLSQDAKPMRAGNIKHIKDSAGIAPILCIYFIQREAETQP